LFVANAECLVSRPPAAWRAAFWIYPVFAYLNGRNPPAERG
jgi:hypothetical protein